MANFTWPPNTSSISFPALAPNGSIAAPSYSFTNFTGSGMTIDPSAFDLDLIHGGTLVMELGATRIATFAPFIAPTGSLSAPSYSFTSHGNTGMTIDSSAFDVDIIHGGVLSAEFGNTRSISFVPWLVASGAVGAPGLGWASETTSGLFRPSAGVTAFAISGAEVARMTSTQFSFSTKALVRSDSSSTSFVSSAAPTLILDNEDTTASNYTGIYSSDDAGTSKIAAIKFLCNDHTTKAGTISLYANSGAGLANILQGVGSTGIVSIGVGGGSATHVVNGNFSFSDTTKSLVGTATNNNAAASYVGEFISANSAGVTPGSSTVYTNVASISLTAGDWDVEGTVAIAPAATLNASQVDIAISTSTGAVDSTANGGIESNQAFLVTGTPVNYLGTGARRISLSGTTTVYLVAALTYTVLSTTTYNSSSFIRARRMR